MNPDLWVGEVHLVATAMMAGLIWFVQVVHYPLFARVGAEGFVEYERVHQARTTLVVAPLMLAELSTAVWFVIDPPGGVVPWLAWVGLGLVGVNWVSTAALQVPMHRWLEAGFEARAHRRLVVTNWVRTAAWTTRVPIALAMIR